MQGIRAFDPDEAARLYSEGLTTKEMAEKLNTSPDNVNRWRRVHNLLVNAECKNCLARFASSAKTNPPPICPDCDSDPQTRWCGNCKLMLDVSLFGARIRSDRTQWVIYSCKDCTNKISSRTGKRGAIAKIKLALAEKQNWSCPVCGLLLTKDDIRLDHDHNCCDGLIEHACGNCYRGVTHNKCNLVLGLVHDNVATLIRAANYLRDAA